MENSPRYPITMNITAELRAIHGLHAWKASIRI